MLFLLTKSEALSLYDLHIVAGGSLLLLLLYVTVAVGCFFDPSITSVFEVKVRSLVLSLLSSLAF